FEIPKCFTYIKSNLYQKEINSFYVKDIKLPFNSLKKYIKHDFQIPLDLSITSCEASIISIENHEKFVLYFKAHHIVFDGQSIILLLKYIAKFLKCRNKIPQESINYQTYLSRYFNEKNSIVKSNLVLIKKFIDDGIDNCALISPPDINN